MSGAEGKKPSPFTSTCLAGRVALVTGGGSGIGLEIAKQLGLHGARVGIMGRREGTLQDATAALHSLGIQAVFFAGDVRRKEDGAGAVNKVLSTWGRLDILVNGAAGNFLAAAEDLSPNGFRTVLDIDAVGTFNMCLAARSALACDAESRKGSDGGSKSDSDGGLIVNISATLHYTASWYQVHVAAAKAAVDATTRSLALEWGREFGIRSNTVAPGPIADTPGMAKLVPRELAMDASAVIPLRRMGEARDIALAVVFLASDAGKFINGANIVVDGGGWLHKERYVEKDVVRALSRKVERRSREQGFVVKEKEKERSRL